MTDKAIWDRIFEEYAEEFRQAPVTVHQQDCFRFLEKQGTTSVLDVGCGIGRWAIPLARSGLTVSGFDLSPTAIEVARRWAADESVPVVLETASVDDRVFVDERFDGVIAPMVLDNLPTDVMEATLARIEAWLEPGGAFYALFNPFLTEAEARDLAAEPNPTSGIQTHYYTDAALHDHLKRFDVRQVKTYEEGVRAFFMTRPPKSA